MLSVCFQDSEEDFDISVSEEDESDYDSDVPLAKAKPKKAKAKPAGVFALLQLHPIPPLIANHNSTAKKATAKPSAKKKATPKALTKSKKPTPAKGNRPFATDALSPLVLS